MQFHSELSESIFSNIPTSLMYSLSNKQAEQISPSIIREKYSDNQNNFVSLKSITGGNPMQIDVDPSKRKSFEPISFKEAIKMKGTKQSDRQLLCMLKNICLKFGTKVSGVRCKRWHARYQKDIRGIFFCWKM